MRVHVPFFSQADAINTKDGRAHFEADAVRVFAFSPGRSRKQVVKTCYLSFSLPAYEFFR